MEENYKIEKIKENIDEFKGDFYNTINMINVYQHCVQLYLSGNNYFIDGNERKTFNCLYGFGEIVKKCLNEIENEMKNLSESVL